MKNKKVNYKKLLQQFLADSKSGLVPTEKVIYVANLLENGIIESYWNGKITKEKMDHYLYEIFGKMIHIDAQSDY